MTALIDPKTTAVILNAQFIVQHAKEADLAEILAIYNQSVAGKQATANLTPVTMAERVDWFNEHINDAKRPIYVVRATDTSSKDISAKDIIAQDIEQAMLQIDRSGASSLPIVAWGSFSDLYARPAYHISSEISIYLHQDYHGKGLGGMLTQWMLTQAPSLGIRNVVALIFAHNQPSLKLFTKLGFGQWGYMPQVCDMQGFIADVVMLGKAISNEKVSDDN